MHRRVYFPAAEQLYDTACPVQRSLHILEPVLARYSAIGAAWDSQSRESLSR